MHLSRLVYVSNCRDITSETLDSILQVSRINNTRDRITGALIIDNKFFLQLIEGDRGAVARCFLRISKDHRHNDVRIISSGDVKDRLFAEWHMHRIETSQIKQEILDQYTFNGKLNPAEMSQFAIEDFCRVLSNENWEPSPD